MRKYSWICAACLMAGCVFTGCSEDKPINTSSTTEEVTCGNGVVETGETCDDGNTESGDGCSGICQTESGYTCTIAGQPCKENTDIEEHENCGNSNLDEGEVCDDGNRVEGDGCSSDCKTVEDGYKCTTPGKACTSTTPQYHNVCGNGVIEEPEVCDDGNTDDGDGCSADCLTITPGYHCDTPNELCHTQCGDNVVTSDEQCDDFLYPGEQPVSGDGCSAECTIEENFICEVNPPSLFSDCRPKTCGDLKVQEEIGEQCDVLPYQQKEHGYDKENNQPYCTRSCKLSTYCGDGLVQENQGEECDKHMVDDDGYPVGGDNSYGGCTSDCKKAGYCGDKIRDPEEACDDGNNDNGDGCSSDCKTIEEGYRCPTEGHPCIRLICGNGEHELGEQCDDGNFVAGDGCFNCRAEEGYKCRYSPKPCTSCTSVQCKLIESEFGDGVLDPDGYEECDDGNTIDNDGCTKGVIDPGYSCPQPGERCIAKACGDGIKAYGEECDDANNEDGDGCSARCKREPGFRCDIPGVLCEGGRCGDGIVQFGEECDNGENPGNGCTHCKIDSGFECLSEGGACRVVVCGNGNMTPTSGYTSGKECDDGNNTNGDGCSSDCRIEPGFHCHSDGSKSVCVKGRCNNGILDAGEECDDGNARPNDGCSPSCKREVMFESYTDDSGNITYHPKCGDGITLWMIKDEAGKPVEECDDGNMISGDGCSSQCKIEKGFQCTDFSAMASQKTIDLDITYYDFRIPGQSTKLAEPTSWTAANELTGGFMTKALYDAIAADNNCKREKFTDSYKDGTRTGYPDFGCTFGGSGCGGMVETKLDSDNKPVLVSDWKTKNCTIRNPDTKINKHVTCKNTHHYWYRYVPGVNLMIKTTLTMQQDKDKADKYTFSSESWYPLDSKGYHSSTANPRAANGGEFTSELHTFFQYKGGETLTFRGDDDVWAFINKTLFVDLGGMQSGNTDTGKLSDNKCLNKDKDGNDVSIVCDSRYDIYENGIYDLHFFQAERCSSGSRYQLTLDGFLKTGQATCNSICGDGIVSGNETCDIKDHVNDKFAQLSGCVNCQKAAVCGNGIIEPGEACDTGYKCVNTSGSYDESFCTAYGVTFTEDPNCDPTECRYTSCGNNHREEYEECDLVDGEWMFSNEALLKGSKCNADTCKVSYCGDGILDEGEVCDNGEANNPNGACTPKCDAPYCGDGIVSESLGEACDLGTDAAGNSLNLGEYTFGTPSCSPDCSFIPPYCGDGVVQKSQHEDCDDGDLNEDGLYNGCTTRCKLGPYCGDGITNGDEECDGGSSCSNTCQRIAN